MRVRTMDDHSGGRESGTEERKKGKGRRKGWERSCVISPPPRPARSVCPAFQPHTRPNRCEAHTPLDTHPTGFRSSAASRPPRPPRQPTSALSAPCPSTPPPSPAIDDDRRPTDDLTLHSPLPTRSRSRSCPRPRRKQPHTHRLDSCSPPANRLARPPPDTCAPPSPPLVPREKGTRPGRGVGRPSGAEARREDAGSIGHGPRQRE